jgi:hypothetical protein
MKRRITDLCLGDVGLVLFLHTIFKKALSEKHAASQAADFYLELI